MASSIYVYDRIESYMRYNRGLIENEKFHTIVIGIFINPKNGDILFVTQYKEQVTIPTVRGHSVKHLYLPHDRSNMLEYMQEKFPEYVLIDPYQDQIRWKHTTETNGVLEFKRREPIKLFGFTLFHLKRTRSKIYTQRIIYSDVLHSSWVKTTNIFYDISRDRISVTLDYF